MRGATARKTSSTKAKTEVAGPVEEEPAKHGDDAARSGNGETKVDIGVDRTYLLQTTLGDRFRRMYFHEATKLFSTVQNTVKCNKKDFIYC